MNNSILWKTIIFRLRLRDTPYLPAENSMLSIMLFNTDIGLKPDTIRPKPTCESFSLFRCDDR